MNTTSNYGLNQWQQADRLMMEDFNADNAKTEQALAELAGSVAELAAKCGNCQIGVLTYTGNGTYAENTSFSITFSRKPLLFLIFSSGAVSMGSCYHDQILFLGYNGTTERATWSGNTITVASMSQDRMGVINKNGVTYHVLAFYAMGE